MRTTNSYHMRGDDKNTRSVQCFVFMITRGRIPLIREMTTYKFGSKAMEIDPVDLRMTSKMWEKKGRVPMGKMMEHTSLYGTNLSDYEKFRIHDEDVCESAGRSHHSRRIKDT